MWLVFIIDKYTSTQNAIYISLCDWGIMYEQALIHHAFGAILQGNGSNHMAYRGQRVLYALAVRYFLKVG